MNNPFYRDEDQKFLFTTLDEMEDALAKAHHGDAAIGDFSAWKERYNYFHDDLTKEPVGGFLQDFLSGVSDTGDAASSLEGAVKRYRDLHNIDDSFFNSENMWEDEKMGKI